MGAVCSTCRHWKLDPVDPNNIGAPRPGECRHGPPTPVALATPQGLVLATLYPKTPAANPACAQHAPTPASLVVPEG